MMNDTDLNDACRAVGVNRKWEDGMLREALSSENGLWLIREKEKDDSRNIIGAFGGYRDNHQAACLLTCKMLDELAQPLDDLRFSPVEVLNLLIDREALLAAYKAVKEKL